MQILLRNLKTRQYYQTADKWTSHQPDARDFETLNQAIALAREKHLARIEVVLAFDDPHRDIHFPLQDPSN